MDEFHFGNVKADKTRAMRSYDLFAAISKTLRILELCVALIVLSWTLTRLPFALRVSTDYLHKLSTVAATPLFVFALSNAIIAALLAQRFATTADNADDPDNNDDAAASDSDGIYEEFLSNGATEGGGPPGMAGKEAEYEDKKVISETVRDSDSRAGHGWPEYRRSQPEKWKGEGGGKTQVVRRELRRSETEKVGQYGRREDHDDLFAQDKLSSEEFQRTIEAFIAKQMRFLREESSATVVQNPS